MANFLFDPFPKPAKSTGKAHEYINARIKQ